MSARCADGRQPTFDVIDVSLDVLRADTVLLKLAGTTTLERDQQHLLVGDKLFFDLVISAEQKTDDDTRYYDFDEHKVTCHIAVRGAARIFLKGVYIFSDQGKPLRISSQNLPC